MIDDAIIKGVTEIANARMKREYPLLDKHFGMHEVGIICQAYDALSEKMEIWAIDERLARSARVEAEFGNMIVGGGA